MIQARLQSYYQHPAAHGAQRTYSVESTFYEHKHEKQLFESFVAGDNGANDLDAAERQVKFRHPGHSLSVPSQQEASWTGKPGNGTLVREEGLFLTYGPEGTPPTFNTISETRFHPFGMEKRSASEGPDGVRVRTTRVDVSEHQECYVEEFFIAK